jgi:hypothetical protein
MLVRKLHNSLDNKRQGMKGEKESLDDSLSRKSSPTSCFENLFTRTSKDEGQSNLVAKKS